MVTKDDILNELVAALKSQDAPPDSTEGWLTIKQLRDQLGLSEATTRRRMRELNGKIEKQRHGGLMYYRLKKA